MGDMMSKMMSNPRAMALMQKVQQNPEDQSDSVARRAEEWAVCNAEVCQRP